jgi:hypothetical protein
MVHHPLPCVQSPIYHPQQVSIFIKKRKKTKGDAPFAQTLLHDAILPFTKIHIQTAGFSLFRPSAINWAVLSTRYASIARFFSIPRPQQYPPTDSLLQRPWSIHHLAPNQTTVLVLLFFPSSNREVDSSYTPHSLYLYDQVLLLFLLL